MYQPSEGDRSLAGLTGRQRRRLHFRVATLRRPQDDDDARAMAAVAGDNWTHLLHTFSLGLLGLVVGVFLQSSPVMWVSAVQIGLVLVMLPGYLIASARERRSRRGDHHGTG